MQYEIRECRLADLRALALTMRPADRAEILASGHTVRHLLFRLWRASVEPKCALVDGEVAACWGDEAGLLSENGVMWLFTTPTVEKIPLAFFREARAEIARRLETRRTIISDIADGYDAALRFFRLLGARIGEPMPGANGSGSYRRMTLGGSA